MFKAIDHDDYYIIIKALCTSGVSYFDIAIIDDPSEPTLINDCFVKCNCVILFHNIIIIIKMTTQACLRTHTIF